MFGVCPCPCVCVCVSVLQHVTATGRVRSATSTRSCTGPPGTAATAGAALTTPTGPTASVALTTTTATSPGIAACPAAAAQWVSSRAYPPQLRLRSPCHTSPTHSRPLTLLLSPLLHSDTHKFILSLTQANTLSPRVRGLEL